jgi:hypothetical protein
MYLEGIIISFKLRCPLVGLVSILKALCIRDMPCKGKMIYMYNTTVHEGSHGGKNIPLAGE